MNHFVTGIPGICNECFLKQKPLERYYFHPHNKQLTVFSEGCWETFRDVEPVNAEAMLQTIR